MKKPTVILSITSILLVLWYITCTSIINIGETGVLLSFGKLIRVINQPGIYHHFPYPFNSMEILDARLTMLQPRPSEFLTADKKNLILENNVCYRIIDPIQFIKTVRDKNGLEIRLIDLLSSHTGMLLGHYELSDLVNTDKQKIKFDEMNTRLTELMRSNSKSLGIEIEKVFIKRIMLPIDNRSAVYKRMRAERNRIAKKYIAEGEETAQKIRAEADRKSRVIIAKAEAEATIIKGQAEADAMKRYGEAYGKNSEFYQFTRSLEAYTKMFNSKATIVLDDTSPLIKSLLSETK